MPCSMRRGTGWRSRSLRGGREMPLGHQPLTLPTPLVSLAQSGGGSMARTAAPAARALARPRFFSPSLRLPPNPRCSRPPCLGDFPRHSVPTTSLVYASLLGGRPAERHRWAALDICHPHFGTCFTVMLMRTSSPASCVIIGHRVESEGISPDIISSASAFYAVYCYYHSRCARGYTVF
jgi:hypothetical protein